jgi:hypothetical protein
VLERGQDAIDGRLGQLDLAADLGQLGRRVVAGNRFEDAHRAQDGRPSGYRFGQVFEDVGMEVGIEL